MQLPIRKVWAVALLGVTNASYGMLMEDSPRLMARPTRTIEDIRKSPLDSSSYRHITLPNGLEAFLISNPKAPKSSATMDVSVGSLHEPDELSGLAHLLGHMLRRGTKKYHDSGEYEEFIRVHGGYQDAYAEDEHARYSLEIESSHFEPALDRFSRFFIDPLFNEDCMENELDVIEKEYRVKSSEWGEVVNHVIKALCKGHPLARFSMGNLQTLKTTPEQEGINVRKRLIEFYETFYSASVMKLAVYGKETLDELEEMVMEKFSGIINRNVKIEFLLGSPIHPRNLQKIVMIGSDLTRQELAFRWDLPGVHDCSYQLSLFNKSGTGSLREYLSRFRGFLSLKANSTYQQGFTTILITIHWSPSKAAPFQDIIEATFGYIKMIKDARVQNDYRDELLSMHELNFRFRVGLAPINVTKRVAKLMHRCEPNDVLLGRQMDALDPEKIQFVTDQLHLDNVIIFCTTPFIPKNFRVEPYLWTNFAVYKMPNELMIKVQSIEPNSTFEMPQPNRYAQLMMLNLDTGGISATMDDLCISDGPIKFWFTHRNSDSPIATIKLALTINRPISSKDHYIHLRLMLDLFMLCHDDMLQEARAANFQFRTRVGLKGVVLSFSGPKEVLLTYLDDILERLLNFVPADQIQLENAKEIVEQTWSIIDGSSPQPRIEVDNILSLEIDTLPELLQNINMDDMTKVGRELFSGRVLCVHHKGWITDEEASNFKERLESLFPVVKPHAEYEKPKLQADELSPGKRVMFTGFANPKNLINIVYLHMGSSHDPKVVALTMLLARIIDSLFSVKIRTEQQWACPPSANFMVHPDSIGVGFVLKGNILPTKMMDKGKCIEGEISRCLTELSPEGLDYYKKAVRDAIESKQFDPFDLWEAVELDQRTLDHLNKGTHQELVELIQDHIRTDAPQMRKKLHYLYGAEYPKLTSVASLKSRGKMQVIDPETLGGLLRYLLLSGELLDDTY